MVATVISPRDNPLDPTILDKVAVPIPVAPEPNGAHCFWDWDNGPLSSGYDADQLLQNIERGLRHRDAEYHVQTFTGVGNYNALGNGEEYADRRSTATRIHDQLLQHIRLFLTPVMTTYCDECGDEYPTISSGDEFFIDQDQFSRFNDVGDAFLAREMKYLQLVYNSPGLILLISEDKDFGLPLQFLAHRGWTILIAETHPTRRSRFRQLATAVWKWSDLIRGDGPIFTQEREDIVLDMSRLWD